MVTHPPCPETHWTEAGRARLVRARALSRRRASIGLGRSSSTLSAAPTDPTRPSPRLTGCSQALTLTAPSAPWGWGRAEGCRAVDGGRGSRVGRHEGGGELAELAGAGGRARRAREGQSFCAAE